MNRFFTLFILMLSSIFALAQEQFSSPPDFFRKERRLPLTEINTVTVMNISSFGAVANDGADDLQGINEAIAVAIALSSDQNPVRLVFEKGQYDLFPPTGNSHCVPVNHANFLVLDGNGAKIVLHNPSVGFMSLYKSKNVIIRDLFIDYDPLPFTQGKVVAVNPAELTFDLTIDEGFPLLSEPYFVSAPQNWGMLKNDSGGIKEKARNLYPYVGWTQLSGNTFRISQPSEVYIEDFEVGDNFVQIARNNGKTIFKNNWGENITYLNITSYASPAGSYNSTNSLEWNVINCRVIPAEGRLQSGNADIIHVPGGYLGPWVEGCRFEAFSDDAVNLKTVKKTILSVQSDTELTVKNFVDKGEFIRFFNPRDGVLLGEGIINKATHVGSGKYQITLSEPVTITTISDHQSGDKAYVDTHASESFVFRNDTIRNGRRYGMLLQNNHGVIENCIFENMSSCGIKIENGVDWGEGFAAHDIDIANNIFINCGFDKSYIEDPVSATISLRIARLGQPCNETDKWCGVETAEWQGLKNIRIYGNKFIYNKTGVKIQNLNTGQIINNIFIHNEQDFSLQPGEKPTVIKINNSADIERYANKGAITSIDELPTQARCLLTIMGKQLRIQNIEGGELIGDVWIYDSAGRSVCRFSVQGSDFTLDMARFRSGVYFVRFASNKTLFSERLVIIN